MQARVLARDKGARICEGAKRGAKGLAYSRSVKLFLGVVSVSKPHEAICIGFFIIFKEIVAPSTLR